ncbi:hypothetical protein [Synechococcus elongatus]|uniref:Uncharacterized protein n=1 Tax=Synechococcus elongatus PCC 11801 TaxID=2219813 RepID=A0AAN1UV20_SYNEL|nr:hypothetical protein [Synechococcus elongatus]AZB73177.1 hypothetical protein DOP62_11040 [Synechococcus elongatus PCC 11801]
MRSLGLSLLISAIAATPAVAQSDFRSVKPSRATYLEARDCQILLQVDQDPPSAIPCERVLVTEGQTSFNFHFVVPEKGEEVLFSFIAPYESADPVSNTNWSGRYGIPAFRIFKPQDPLPVLQGEGRCNLEARRMSCQFQSVGADQEPVLVKAAAILQKDLPTVSGR